MNEISEALVISKGVESLGIIGFLVLFVIILIFLLRDKKKMEELLERITQSIENSSKSMEAMIEINKKYQTYYEKMIEDTKKERADHEKIIESITQKSSRVLKKGI